MLILKLVGAAVIVALLALVGWRQADRRAEARLDSALRALQPADPPRFDPAMVADLPDAARRYFAYTITPGTPLRTVAEIEMTGQIGLGNKATPNYRPMRARQILAAPHGFVWRVRAGTGAAWIVGSDAAGPRTSWSRFWLLGLVPVARAGGDADHARSSAGRYLAEAAFWSPAALLPGPGVRWEPAGPDAARVTVTRDGHATGVEITVDPEGRPVSVVLQRWSNANPEASYRLQPFGGTMSGFRDFDGFTLPTRVEGGNFFGTDDYFPFFRAEVHDIAFPSP